MAINHLQQDKLCLAVIHFLEDNGCTTTLTKRETEFHIQYTLKNDVKPQPAIRVTDKPSLVIPAGSQEDIVFAFFNWLV